MRAANRAQVLESTACVYCSFPRRKNKQLSDSMDTAFAAVSLPWLYRRAVAFLNHLQVSI